MYPHLRINNSKCRYRLTVVFIYLVTLVAVSKAVSLPNQSKLRVKTVKSEGSPLLATIRLSSNRKEHPQQLQRRQQKKAPSPANNITGGYNNSSGINSNTTGSFPPANSSSCCLPEQWNSFGWDTSEMLVFMIFLIWIIFACLLFFICACCHPRMHRGDLEARGFDEALQNYILMTIVQAQRMSEMIREKEKLASLILEKTKMLVTEECFLSDSCKQKTIVSRDNLNNEKFDSQPPTLQCDIETCSASIRHASHFVNIPDYNTETLKRFPNGGPRLVPNSCVICLESYSLGDHLCWSANVGCSHAFHFSCIEPWCCKIIKEQPATKQIACPCCRQDFVKLDEEDDRPATENEELSSSSYDEENRP